jgi:hypothetical protein
VKLLAALFELAAKPFCIQFDSHLTRVRP